MSINLDGTTGITAPAIDIATPLTTADGGTNVTSPGPSGNVLTSDGTNWTSSTGVVGVSQSYTAYTSPTRVAGTTYTNTTSKPIFVIVSFGMNFTGTPTCTITVGGVVIHNGTMGSATTGGINIPYSVSFIVPVGVSYLVTVGGITTVKSWAELS